MYQALLQALYIAYHLLYKDFNEYLLSAFDREGPTEITKVI